MLSMKDYANQKNISYEAVRKQVARYRKELDGHIFKKDRTQFLDEYAIEFLDQKRSSNPIVIYETSKDETINRLNQEVDQLKTQVMNLQNALLKEREAMLPLQQSLQLADIEKEKAIHAALKEAGEQAEIEKKRAVSEAVQEANQKAQNEKSEAVDAAKRDTAAEKEKEFETVRNQFDSELQELRKELERPLTFMERLTGKRK